MSEQSAGADRSARPGPSDKTLTRSYLDALRAADVAGAYKVASAGLEGGMSLAILYQRVVTPAMHELGRLWKQGAITVADEHLATAVTHRVLAALRPPQSFEQPSRSGLEVPTALLAAVQGEQHALGLRMAADLLEDGGYRIAYLGADVPTDALLQAVRTVSPSLLGLSATMPESTLRLEEAVEAVRAERPRLSLVIGGQGSGSPRLDGETVVENLELLAEAAPVP
ncbi:MAG TPA: cobalamin-dependent protein [Solirubrobacterales bacterium]|nr:cobalamin-dependent protein [Solirubrobacterales bacterium]